MNDQKMHSKPIILASMSFENSGYFLEGDCACPPVRIARESGRRLADAPQRMVLYQVPVTSIDIDDKYTAVLTPSRSHSLTILNRLATDVWHAFDEPTTIADIFSGGKRHLPLEMAQNAASRLWQLGFLADEPISLPPVPEPDTLMVWLHVTNACNLRCTYCYVDKNEQAMDAQTGKEAIDAVFRSAVSHRYPRLKIKYAGGEALLNVSQIIETHQYARRLADEADIELDGVVLSNGVALSKRHIEAMKAHRLRLMISLDGIGKTHDIQRMFANGKGSFELVKRGIETAVSHHLIPHISITVTSKNAASLAQTIKWILGRNLPFSLNFYRDTTAATDFQTLCQSEQKIIDGLLAAFKVIERNLPPQNLLSSLGDRANLAVPHTHPCAAGNDYMVIDQNGRIAKCQMHLQDTVTTIRSQDPLRLIQNSTISLQNIPVTQKEGCQICQWQYWCAGGCPAETYRVTGRYDIKSPNCRIYKTIFPEIVRLEGLRLLKQAQLKRGSQVGNDG